MKRPADDGADLWDIKKRPRRLFKHKLSHEDSDGTHHAFVATSVRVLNQGSFSTLDNWFKDIANVPESLGTSLPKEAFLSAPTTNELQDCWERHAACVLRGGSYILDHTELYSLLGGKSTLVTFSRT